MGQEQRLRQQIAELQARADKDSKAKQELERLEEGQEVTAQQAEMLQPQIGNAALATLLARSTSSSQSASASSGQDEELAEEMVETQEEEELQHEEAEGPQFGGGGGGGGGGGPSDPWDLGRLFGGDDEGGGAEGGGTNQPRLRASPIRDLEDPFDEDPLPDEVEDSPTATHLAEVELRLPASAVSTRSRRGDARYASLDGALLEARLIAMIRLDPEDLADESQDHEHLRRPLELARFLAVAAISPLTRALGRGIAGGASFFVPACTGGSGAAARLATLAITALACEAEEAAGGQGVAGPDDDLARSIDRSARLALAREAWQAAVQTARELASKRRLRAPHIADVALAGRLDVGEERPGVELPPDSLGGRALFSLLPATPLLFIPPLERRPPPPVADDEELATIDALLAGWTGGDDATELPPDPVLDAAALEPALNAASDLVNAMGRAQVELAAGAIAARLVHPLAPVRQILVHGDRALRLLARDAVEAGDQLAALRDTPLTEAEEQAAPLLRALRQAALGLEVLRTWALGELASAAVGADSTLAGQPPALPAPLVAALDLREGGDRVGGRQGLRSCLHRPGTEVIATPLAAWAALEAGDGPEATILLDRILARGGVGPLTLAAASMRTGLALTAGSIDQARTAAQLQAQIARARHNPIAQADAAIVLSEAHLREDGLQRCVDGLVAHVLELGEAGDLAATELLKARLTELRATQDPDRFDLCLEAAIRAREEAFRR